MFPFGLFAPFLAGITRTILGNIAGMLVMNGFLQANQVNSFVGACLLFGTIGWSIWQKLNTPHMLDHLTARMKARNVKDAAFGFPNTLAIIGICGFALAALAPAPVKAQGVTFFNTPPAVHHRRKMAKPMHAGLSSLIQSVAPVQVSVQGPDQIWANVEKIALADLEMAVTNANAVNPPTALSKARAGCYTSLIALISQQTSAQTATAGKAVGSGVFTRFEAMAQLADALQSGSPVQVQCAPVAQAMRLQIGQFILGVTGGALSLAKFGVPLP